MPAPYTITESTNYDRILAGVLERIAHATEGLEDDPSKRAEIAERLGVVPSGIDNLFARKWSIETAMRIAELLGIELEVVDVSRSSKGSST